MKYIYYKDVENGKIQNFHKANPEWNDEELNNRLVEYNKASKSNFAFVIDIEKDSFIDFLIHKANERVKINKETLEDLDDALSEASSIVNNLRYGGSQ